MIELDKQDVNTATEVVDLNDNSLYNKKPSNSS
jgi:hypothetical protein